MEFPQGMSSIFALASLLLTLLLAPLVGTVLLLFSCYRQLVTLFLRYTDAKFAGLLHGTDAFWALEDEASRSIINVLALADFSFIVSASYQGRLVDLLNVSRIKTKNHLLGVSTVAVQSTNLSIVEYQEGSGNIFS